MKRRESGDRNVKIASDVNIIQRNHKAPGGLIRTVFELKDNTITNLSISGDFFCYPSDSISRLEALLEGVEMREIDKLLEDFYADTEIEIPGISPDDWKKVLNG